MRLSFKGAVVLLALLTACIWMLVGGALAMNNKESITMLNHPVSHTEDQPQKKDMPVLPVNEKQTTSPLDAIVVSDDTNSISIDVLLEELDKNTE